MFSHRRAAAVAAAGFLTTMATPAGAERDAALDGLDQITAGLPLPAPGVLPPPLTEKPQKRDRPSRPRRARLTARGRAVAPAGAPERVKRIIRAANRIAHKPYVYGGGHGSWKASGYDCSGSVSYALHGGGLLDTQLASGALASWGRRGRGRWVTVYANGGHVYMVVAGLRFDTSARGRTGSRWTRDVRPSAGYAVRHPAGL